MQATGEEPDQMLDFAALFLDCLLIYHKKDARLKCFSSLHAGLFSMLFLLSAIFFNINFFKNSFRNTIRVSNSLAPDQD